jgi:hypothetical protein
MFHYARYALGFIYVLRVDHILIIYLWCIITFNLFSPALTLSSISKFFKPKDHFHAKSSIWDILSFFKKNWGINGIPYLLLWHIKLLFCFVAYHVILLCGISSSFVLCLCLIKDMILSCCIVKEKERFDSSTDEE